MMPRRAGALSIAIVVAALLLPSATATAQELSAAYLEGDVALDNSGQLSIGDPLPQSGTVVLGDSGYLEIVGLGRTVRLLGPGEYLLAELFPSDGESASLTSAVTSRVRRLIRDERRGDIAAAGVRGDLAGESGWASGPAADLRLAAEEALRAGRVESAEALYREALLYAVGTEAGIRLDLAELHLSRGEMGAVVDVTAPIDTVEEMEPRVRGRYYLVRGSALLELGEGEAALELLLDARGRRIPAATAPLLELLAAEAALTLGDQGAAASALERVVELAPDSPQATAARRMLAQM